MILISEFQTWYFYKASKQIHEAIYTTTWINYYILEAEETTSTYSKRAVKIIPFDKADNQMNPIHDIIGMLYTGQGSRNFLSHCLCARKKLRVLVRGWFYFCLIKRALVF